ncbi:cell wall hydrolase [Paracoccus sp. MBLB3053]|uniref:Cell wall hydrolase n=1 Tax=Paracoccus aurantius TaxID=3073814 RepID=A0ABU2I0C0_9RHOB|nr:cell wall hydrolase [Paracoccus sp. MBLB3053]MDS9469984.1 cell wall hydrolase [Paracoccus sp. MBLB3053]
MKSTISKLRIAAGLSAVLVMAGCGMPGRHSALECMERAMYFESNRSSRDGMIAVGSVVMNRVESSRYPNSVCAVVAQKGQFAPGIMRRKMDKKSMPLVRDSARAVLRGERHPMIGDAMFFHAASHRFGYDNMHYVLVAGGNAFYERRKNYLVTQPVPPRPIENLTGR